MMPITASVNYERIWTLDNANRVLLHRADTLSLVELRCCQNRMFNEFDWPLIQSKRCALVFSTKRVRFRQTLLSRSMQNSVSNDPTERPFS